MRRNRRDRTRGLAAAAGLALAAALVAASAPPAAAQDQRQLGAHRHGHGTLAIAIEGNTVQLELEAPGADIVGFEHPATTKADKARVAAARGKLADPSSLVALPAGAGCKVTAAEVELEGEEEHGRTHRDDKPAAHGEAIHSEFHTEYAFACADAAAITGIAFPYFRSFPNAEELAVTLVTRKGQKTFEVSRGKARIDIRDML